MNRRLLLFDIDGTLIQRGDPAHLAAIDHGVHAVFPETVDVSAFEVDFDGKVDRQLCRDLLTSGGVTGWVPGVDLEPVLAAAAEAYEASCNGHEDADDLLPGVRALLERLAMDDRFRLGVVTGGSRGIVEIKLRRRALSQFFPIGGFGDEADQRPDLIPLAVARAERHYGTSFPCEAVVIVGDTPHDIACARAFCAPSLGVASGRYSTGELADAGADVAVPDLIDLDGISELLWTIRRKT